MNKEIRTQAIQSIIGPAMMFMKATFFGNPEHQVEMKQGAKLLLAIGASQGMFKEPKLREIYTDKSMNSIDKLFTVGEVMMNTMIQSDEFHNQIGEWTDEQLAELYSTLKIAFEGESYESSS